MPWSGGSFTRTNGVNTGSTLWAEDRDDGYKILASHHDTHDQDLATGINSTLEKSGSNAATGNLNIGSNRLTAVADGTAKTDAATVNQIQSNAAAYAVATGTATAQVVALSPAITAYTAGQRISFKANATSTGATTVNVNAIGAKTLKKLHDQDIAAGDIESGSVVTAIYDGTNYQVTSQLASEAGTPAGSNTQVQYNASGSFAGDADFVFDGTNVSFANPIYLGDGAVATPSVTNTGDVNTGIYFPAADTVGITTGGVEQFRFGSSDIRSDNAIINGNFLVAQRGTTFASGDNNDDTYNLDRWLINSDGNDIVDITQTSATTGGITLDVETTNKKFGIVQIIEAKNCNGLIGNTATLSFQAKVSDTSKLDNIKAAIIAWNSTADAVTSDIVASWAVEGTATTLASNLTYEGSTPANLSVTTSFAKYSVTADIDTSSTTNIVVFIWSDVLDSTAGHTLSIKEVQLELGSVATSYQHRTYANTFADCQRYYQRLDANTTADQQILFGFFSSTSMVRCFWDFQTPMRTAPTMSNSAAATFEIADGKDTVGANDATATSYTGNVTCADRAMFRANYGGTGYTAGETGYIRRDSSDATFIIADAEM